jgi:phosphonate transport system substrate-binding protein
MLQHAMPKGLCAFLLLFGIGLPSLAAEKGAQIEIGIAPFLPVRTTVHNYEPMRVYLERRLKQPVTFVTAPDYRTFNERTSRYEYPFIITVANAAYLACMDAGYVPLLQPRNATWPVLVVAKDDPLPNLEALRDRKIALPDQMAVISMQALRMLREAGLDPDRDVVIQYARNHGAAVNHVLAAEASAAIVSNRAFMQLPAATRSKARVVQEWKKGAAPGVVYLASPKLPHEQVERLRQAIMEFAHDTAEGRELMKHLGYDDLVPIDANGLKPLAGYGSALRELLSRPK